MAKDGSGPARTTVLIEIGSEWLKIIQAEPHRGGLGISKIHLEKVAGSSKSISDQVKAALRKGKFAKGRVISCLPRQMVTVRMLELPSTDHEEIGDMVDLQLGKQTPYSRDEIAFDYRVAGSGRDGYTRVMLAIVQRSTIRDRHYILEEAGVEVERTTVSAEGMLNWCAAAFPRRSAGAVLDVDSSHCDLAVMVNGVLAFTKNISIGAGQLQAEPGKWREKLALDVRRSLETCENELPGVKLGKLLICGAGVNTDGLEKYLGDQVGIVTEAKGSLAVAKKVPKKPLLDEPEYASASLTAIVGMAADPRNLEFNLVPDSVILRKELTTKAKSLTTLSMLTLSVLVFASLYATTELFLKKSKLGGLDRALAQSEPEVTAVTRMREIIRVAGERKDRKFTAINLLSQVHPLVPEKVIFDSVEIDAEKREMYLGGLAPTRPHVRVLVKNLEDSSLLCDVKQTRSQAEKGKIRFQIVCSLERTG